MKIRELEERDFAGLSELTLAIYDELPRATSFAHKPTSQELEELMQKKIQGVREHRLADFVAVEGDRVIADCEIVKATDSGGALGIIIAKEHRRRGLGRKLVERGVAKARELKMLEVYAEIGEENAAVANFFAECGFIEQAEEGKELVMVRSL